MCTAIEQAETTQVVNKHTYGDRKELADDG